MGLGAGELSVDEAPDFLKGGPTPTGLASEACLGIGSFSRESNTPWTYPKFSVLEVK